MLTSSNPTGNIEKSCRDDDLLFFDNNKELTCLYLKESLQSKKDFWCSRPLAKYFCPATCNACKCRDDKTANFISINNEETTCLSLANFAKSKREFWCEKLDNAQSYCPATCGTCI